MSFWPFQKRQVKAAREIVKNWPILDDDFISDLKVYKPNYFAEIHEHLVTAKILFLKASDECEYRVISLVGVVERKEINCCNHKEMDSDANPSFLCNMRDCPKLFDFIGEK